MSEGIDLWRSLYEGFNRGDVEATLERVDPAAELVPALTGPGVRGRYQGRDEFRQFFETITETWDSMVVEPEEVIDVPDGRILAVEHWIAQGRDGIKIDTKLIDLYTFKDGLVVTARGYRDKAEAFEAAGLSE